MHLSAILDIGSGQWIYRERLPRGPRELCKGGNSQTEMTQSNQQLNLQNSLAQQQLQQQNQMLSMAKGQIGMVNPSLQAIIANGGMLPQQEAAMRSLAINQLPQQYNSLVGQINNQLVQRGVTGGFNAGSGDIARQFGSLGAQEAGQELQSLEGIQLAKGQGLFNAMNTALGTAGAYGSLGAQSGANVGTFNSGASSSLGSGVTSAGNADQNQTGFWGGLFGALTSPFSISKSFGK
jgi:hypothetical protein